MINGIINVYKEKGFTSFDVVAIMKGICKQKKIGHTGTLDPDAEGVLPICLGSATKLCDMLTDKTKEYVADFMLGYSTDTLDSSGEVLECKTVTVDTETLSKTIMSFVGEYDQIPPMYSALKVDGKRLYELAREGKTIERKSRRVKISNIEILKMDIPNIRIRVVCSKGTYIRSLCADIGNACSELATMTHLTRTRVGSYSIEDAKKLSELEEIRDRGLLENYVLSVDSAFMDCPKRKVLAEYEKLLKNGNKLHDSMFLSDNGLANDNTNDEEDESKIRVYDKDDQFTGVYVKSKEESMWVPKKMFLSL